MFKLFVVLLNIEFVFFFVELGMEVGVFGLISDGVLISEVGDVLGGGWSVGGGGGGIM